MSNLNVLLVDDHSVVRMGFKMLIDSEKDMQVIAEAETGEDGIIKFQEIKPDVIVMDITMPGIGGLEAIERIIAKDKKIRKIVHNFQKKCAYKPPKNFNGSILDGRDITSVIMKDAMFKFFITASVKIRAKRRYKELRSYNIKISYNDVLKSIKNRDKNDYTRKISPLKKTKDSTLINTTNLTKRSCFLKIKQIMDKKLNY